MDLVVDDRPVSVPGEGFFAGGPDFVVSSAQMKRWKDGLPISAEEKQRILDHIVREAPEQGLRVEID